MPYSDLIRKHAQRVGIDPALMESIMRVESGGDPKAKTGSYKGLFQLSDREFGSSGDIYDPEQNIMAAANKFAKESLAFKEKYGRDPKPIDIYMIHQQGQAGYAQHLANPDAPAWQNMAKTREGREKGEAWAREAVWGNLPKSEKARLGSVENVTSRDFITAWDDSIKGGGATFAEGKPSKEKAAFMEGKDQPQAKDQSKRMASILGSMEFDVPQPRIDLRIPDFTPRFKVG